MPEPSRVRVWTARVAKHGLNAVLIVVVLVLGTYLSRRLWLEELLIRELEARLADALGAEVSVGGIGGNWLDTLIVHELSIRKSELVEVANGHVEVELSPASLLEGQWLDFLHGAHISAERVRVTIPRTPPETEPTEAEPVTLPEDLVELATRIAPSGIRVRVFDAELSTPHGTLRDQLRITLEPRKPLRSVVVAFSDLELEGEVWSSSHVHVDAAVAGPGELLRTFGLETELHGGELRAHFDVRPPATLAVDVSLAGARLAARGRVALDARVELPSKGHWRAERLSFSMPGARLTAHELGIADPRTGRNLLASVAGEIDVSIEDCARFRDLMPVEIAPWLPAEGHLSGRIDDARLVVGSGRFVWSEGAVVEIDEGSIPLEDPRRGDDAELALVASLPEPRTFDVGESLTLAGSIRASVRGALTAPEIAAELALDTGSFGATRWSSCTGAVTLAPDLAATFDVVAEGLAHEVPALDVAPVRVAARGTLAPEPLVIHAQLDVDERSTPTRSAITIDGSVALEDGVVSTSGLRIGGPVTTTLIGSLAIDAGTIDASCEQLGVALGEAASIARQHLPAGSVDGRLAVRGALLDPSIDASLDAVLPDLTDDALAELWPRAFGPRPADPVEIQLSLARNPGRLEVRTLRARVGDVVSITGEGTPPVGWNGSRLVVLDTADGLRGSVEARLAPPDAQPTTFRSAFAWDAHAFRVVRLELDGFEQNVRGQARLDGLAHAVTGELAIGDVAVDVTFDAEPLDLRLLPREWTGFGALAGTLQMSARVVGTLGAPQPSGSIVLEDGRAKIGRLPSIDEFAIDARLVTDPVGAARLDIESARGSLGAGPFELRGSITTASLTPDELADVEVDVQLTGDNLLLLRETGARLRGDTSLTAAGTLADLQVAGAVELTSGRFVRRISLVPDFRTKGGASASRGLDLPKIPEPLGSALKFDVQVRTQEPIEVALHIVEAPLDVSARLRGTGAAPLLEGGVSTLEGKVRLPAMTLEIEQGYVNFDPERPSFPRVVAQAKGRRLGVDVQAQVEGPLDDIVVTLGSTPALAQEDITILLTTGRLPDDLRERGLQSQAALVGSYLAQEIIDFYFGSDSTEQSDSFVDRFSFESGREISSNGTESLTAEFSIGDGWYMQAERDVYEDYNMGVLYRIRF